MEHSNEYSPKTVRHRYPSTGSIVSTNPYKRSTYIYTDTLSVSAGALVKLSYLPNYGKTGDWLWDSRNLTVWTVVECNLGVVAGNLPCMKPLFRRVLGSTYGPNSQKPTNSKYLSRGAGTGVYNDQNYNALGSNKTQDHDFTPYGGASEAHMMTTIAVDHRRSNSVSRDNSADRSPTQSSVESVTWLNDQSFGKAMGGITKTTEVNVSKSGAGSEVGDSTRDEQKEAQIV